MQPRGRWPLGWDQIADYGAGFDKFVNGSFDARFAAFVERKVLDDLGLASI